MPKKITTNNAKKAEAKAKKPASKKTAKKSTKKQVGNDVEISNITDNESCLMTVEIGVEFGPVLRCSLDVLELAHELLPLIPKEYKSQKKELKSRIRTMATFALATLEPKGVSFND